MWHRISFFDLLVEILVVILCSLLIITMMNVWALAGEPNKNPEPKGMTAERFEYNSYFAEGTTRPGFNEYLTVAGLSNKDGDI